MAHLSDIFHSSGRNTGSPVGAIDTFTTPSLPLGYLMADGRKFSKHDYADLYKVLGKEVTPIVEDNELPVGSMMPWLKGDHIPNGWHNLGAQNAAEVGKKRVYYATEYPEFVKFMTNDTLASEYELPILSDGEVLRQVVKINPKTVNSAWSVRDITVPWIMQSDAIRNMKTTLTSSTTGNHLHSGTTAATGNHSHSGNTAAAGNHSHSGTTAVTGDHFHGNGWGEYQAGSRHGVYSTSLSTGANGGVDWDNYEGKTSTNGSHAHSFGTNATGNHAHAFGTNVTGNHSHQFSTNTVGNHSHTTEFDASKLVSTAVDVRMANRSVNYLIKVKMTGSRKYYGVKAASCVNDSGMAGIASIQKELDLLKSEIAKLKK